MSYYFGPEWTWERWQWGSTPYSPKLKRYWSLTHRLFCVISRKLVVGVLFICRDLVGVFYSPCRLASFWREVLPLCRDLVGVFISLADWLRFGERSYPSVETQSVYSLVPADWAINWWKSNRYSPSGSKNNNNRVKPHSSEFQNWNLTIWWS